MSRKRKQKQEPPRRLTVYEALAQQTLTDPQDWRDVTRGTAAYRKGWRYYNIVTGDHAKHPGS